MNEANFVTDVKLVKDLHTTNVDQLHAYLQQHERHENEVRLMHEHALEQFQVNTKFLNTLPDEWSKFVTDVKLVKDLHTTNVDQLHAYLQQHERHENEVRLMHERGDNKPPMLEKHLYDSWKSRMELYMLNRPHGRMILASVEKGPLVWPSITVDGATRLKEYIELTPAEAI
ncbi:hypothetical protein Tco_0521161 [Tanacetum coccineum]